MTEKFDYELALADIKAGKPLTGKNYILSPLVIFLEGRLDGTLELCFYEQAGTTLAQNSERPLKIPASGRIDNHGSQRTESDLASGCLKYQRTTI